jgi:hypothetical protein
MFVVSPAPATSDAYITGVLPAYVMAGLVPAIHVLNAVLA